MNTIDFFIKEKKIDKTNHIILATTIGGSLGFFGGILLISALLTPLTDPIIFGILLLISSGAILGPITAYLAIGGSIAALSAGTIAAKVTSLLEGNIKNKKYKPLDYKVNDPIFER